MPPIVNPYLKKKPTASSSSNAAAGARPRPAPSTNRPAVVRQGTGGTSNSSNAGAKHVVAPSRKPVPPASAHVRRPIGDVNVARSTQQGGAAGRYPTKAPTNVNGNAQRRPPSQQQMRQQHNAAKRPAPAHPQKVVGRQRPNQRPVPVAASGLPNKQQQPPPRQVRPTNVPPGKKPLPPVAASATARRQPVTLKAKLRQQIADLKRAKLQKKLDKEAAIRKKKLEEQQRIEAARLAEIRKREEAERAKREARREVSGVLSRIVEEIAVKNGEIRPSPPKAPKAKKTPITSTGTKATATPIVANQNHPVHQSAHTQLQPQYWPMQSPLLPMVPNASMPYHPNMGYQNQMQYQQVAASQAQQMQVTRVYPPHRSNSIVNGANILTESKAHPYPYEGPTSNTAVNINKEAVGNIACSAPTKTPSTSATSNPKMITPSPHVSAGNITPKKEESEPDEANKVLSFTPSESKPSGSTTNVGKASPSQLDSPWKQDAIIDNILRQMEDFEKMSPTSSDNLDISPIRIEGLGDGDTPKAKCDLLQEHSSRDLKQISAPPKQMLPPPSVPKLPKTEKKAKKTSSQGSQTGASPKVLPIHPPNVYGASAHPSMYNAAASHPYPQPYPYPQLPNYSNQLYPPPQMALPPMVNSVNPLALVKTPSHPLSPAPVMQPPATVTTKYNRSLTPVSALLAKDLLKAPSPYATSHMLVEAPITITKDVGGSFGMDLRHTTKSALVEPPPLPGEQKPRKQRRRRIYFAALMVTTADKQNARKDIAKEGSDIVRPGDVILSVDGKSVGDLTFKEACGLFAAAKTPANGGEKKTVQCLITVARSKVPAAAPISNAVNPTGPMLLGPNGLPRPPAVKIPFVLSPVKIPFVLSPGGGVISGEFTDSELKALADGFKTVRKYGDLIIPVPQRPETLSFVTNLLTDSLTAPSLSRRDVHALAMKLSYSKATTNGLIKAEAAKHWRKKWTEECEQASKKNIESNVVLLGTELMSDARRSRLRLLPRPGQGCKCGGTDHLYAHDERCILYRDVIPHVSSKELEAFKSSRKKMRQKKGDADIDSAIATALQERQKKAKEQQEAERLEAQYVELMEMTQVTKLKKAIFAPGLLSVCIISAVATMMDKYAMNEEGGEESDDEDDEDDDIPLSALPSTSSSPPTKKRKIEEASTPTQPNFTIVAEIMLHISKTWGHLLGEAATHGDYAWYLKLGGLDFGSASLDQYRRNPRRPESLSFENIQFFVNESMISRMKKSLSGPEGSVPTNKPTETMTIPTQKSINAETGTESTNTSSTPQTPTQGRKDELTIALLSSQEVTGLYDEIQAMVKSEVLFVRQRDGAIVLQSGWQDCIGASILLDGQERRWFKEDDPANLFCLHNAVRSLTDYWERRNNGWAMTDNEQNGEVDFVDEEYFSIKQEFTREYSGHFDAMDGVERFNI